MLSKRVELPEYGIKFTVKTETGRDLLMKEMLYPKFVSENDLDWQGSWQFIRALVQSTEVEAPFDWPELTAPIEELKAVRDCWLDMPSAVIKAWAAALAEVDKPPMIDPDLSPDTEKNG